MFPGLLATGRSCPQRLRVCVTLGGGLPLAGTHSCHGGSESAAQEGRASPCPKRQRPSWGSVADARSPGEPEAVRGKPGLPEGMQGQGGHQPGEAEGPGIWLESSPPPVFLRPVGWREQLVDGECALWLESLCGRLLQELCPVDSAHTGDLTAWCMECRGPHRPAGRSGAPRSPG